MAFDEYSVPTRLMTSDEVLVSLVDLTRDEFGDPALLHPKRDDPARLLIMAIGAGDVRAIGKRLNTLFRLSIPESTWRQVLLPKRKKTIGDACDFIACHARVPVVEPVKVLGDESLAAGAFLAIRRVLAECGNDVSDLRPSAPLVGYFRRNFDETVLRLMLLAPNRLPPASIESPVQAALSLGLIASFVMVFASRLLHLPWLVTINAIACIAVLWTIAWTCRNRIKPRAVRFGAARTFGDLARVIAGERCAYPGFPVVMR